MAVELALKNGNADAVRAQLGADPAVQARFDVALAVQSATASPEASRVSLRTQEEIEKRQAARNAAAAMVEERKAALRNAAGPGFTELLSSMDLDNLEEAEPLIEGFLVKESVVRLYGPPKSYKSFIMLDMAGCVGAGIKWAGNRTVQSKVLYVVAEGVRGIKRRVRAWEAQNKRPMMGVHFYPRAVQLGEENDVSALIATAKRGGYEFIILDTQARCTVGLEENSASEMGVVVAALDVLKEVTGACVALVHHSGANGGRARGSTAILGALDAEFEVEADKDNYTVDVHTKAQKDLAEAKSVTFDLSTPGPGLALAVKPRLAALWYQQRVEDMPELPAFQRQVLGVVAAFAGAGGTLSLVASRMGDNTDRASVQEALGQLHRRGCIKQKGATWLIDFTGERYLRRGAQIDES